MAGTRTGQLRVGGLLLCGGESSRMGQDKASLELSGEPLLARVTRVLRAATDPVIAVAAPGQTLPVLPEGLEVVRDTVAGRGPLQGMAAGMDALAGRCDAAFVSACDVPWLRVEFARRIIDLLEGFDAAVPVIDGQPYPLSAAYRLSIRPAIDRLLAQDRRSPKLLLERTHCRIIQRHEIADVDPELDSLRDLTTPEDYDRAIRDPF